MSPFFRILIFYPITFFGIIHSTYPQSSFNGDIIIGLGINLPAAHPVLQIGSGEVALKSARKISGGIGISFSRKHFGIKSELVLSHSSYYDPQSDYSLMNNFFENYIGDSPMVDLACFNSRLMGYFSTDSTSEIRYYAGVSLSKVLWEVIEVPWQKAIVAGIEFNIIKRKSGILRLGFFYDYDMAKVFSIPVFLFEYGVNGNFRMARNNVFRIQLSYQPNLKRFFSQKKKPTIKTPRYIIK